MSPGARAQFVSFAAAVRHLYGDRLQGLYAFEYRVEDEDAADADVAVILRDGDWTFHGEKKRLAELTFDILVDTEAYIRAWPLPASAWRAPSTYVDPDLVQEIKRRSEPIMEAA